MREDATAENLFLNIPISSAVTPHAQDKLPKISPFIGPEKSKFSMYRSSKKFKLSRMPHMFSVTQLLKMDESPRPRPVHL